MHRRSLFEPDYSSTTTFPRCSFIPVSQLPRSMASLPSCHRQHKHVQFSPSKENEVYWIQRRNSQKLPVQTEALLNRIAIILLLIRKQHDELQVLETTESKLSIRCDELIQECERAGLLRVLDARKARLSTEALLYHLDQDIATMREDTVHLKSEMQQMLALAAQRLRDQEAATENNGQAFSKRISDLKDLFMTQVRSAFESEGLRAQAHISFPESANERTARCA